MVVDKLASMLALQKELQDRLNTLNFANENERTDFIKSHAQYADQELHEMLRELPYFKSWKTYNDMPVDWEYRAKMELVDALHFILNIALALNMTAEELYTMYCIKNNINHDRQTGGY